MDKTNLCDLIEKYVDGSATDDERQELLDWYRSFDHERVEWPIEAGQDDKKEILDRVLSTLKSNYFTEKAIMSSITSPTEMNNPLMIASSPLKTNYFDETIMSSITSQTEMNNPLMIASSPLKTNYFDEKVSKGCKGFFQKRRFAYAAIALLALGITLSFFIHQKPAEDIEVFVDNQLTNEILPGTNKATLTLSNGAVIDLTDLEKEEILLGDGTTVLRNKNGELIYAGHNSQGLKASKAILYNTMVTPKGGQYQILLADGSRVWLNAESSLYFPTEFVGKTRMVVLTGEAYFEVAKNKDMPFIVSMEDMEIEVVGTQFNVKAYSEENNIYTTLVEGAVRINSGGAPVLLTPGEHADFNRKNGKVHVVATDIDSEIAWKNGYFVFNNEDIKSIMQNLSRWYNVDVEYKGDMVDKEFTGRILRRSNISDVLHMLELTGTINFEIEGRRIIVMP